jgi:hypothetical protein
MDNRVLKPKANWLTTNEFEELYGVRANTVQVDYHYNKNPFKYKKIDYGNTRYGLLLINESYVIKNIEMLKRIQHQAQVFYYVFSKQFSDSQLIKIVEIVEADNFKNTGTKSSWMIFFSRDLFINFQCLDIDSNEEVHQLLQPRIHTKTWIWYRVARWILIKGSRLKGKKYNFKDLERWLYGSN